MKIIFARSPYSIIINEATQIETKLELFLWSNGNSVPIAPNFQYSSLIPSLTQRIAFYDISNQALEFVDNINPDYLSASESTNMWAYAKVKKYYRTTTGGAWIQSGIDESFIIVNGFTEFMDGANLTIDKDFVPLTSDITITSAFAFSYFIGIQSVPMDIDSKLKPYVNAIIQPQSGYSYYINYNSPTEYSSTITLSLPNAVNFIKIPLNNGTYSYGSAYDVSIYSSNVSGVYNLLWQRRIEPDCSPIYKPMLCSFINKFGGWENIWFTRASEESISIKGSNYNIAPQTLFYNPLRGQKKNFNVNGNRTIKCNTGFVSENLFKDLIAELLMSETILLNSLPVISKTTSSVMKTHLKDRNINYEIDFEYAFQMINNIQ